jgi:hypothetical protein
MIPPPSSKLLTRSPTDFFFFPSRLPPPRFIEGMSIGCLRVDDDDEDAAADGLESSAAVMAVGVEEGGRFEGIGGGREGGMGRPEDVRR